jgi:hypothetical protein
MLEDPRSFAVVFTCLTFISRQLAWSSNYLIHTEKKEEERIRNMYISVLASCWGEGGWSQ